MAQSLSKLFVHIIFHIKNDSVEIRNEEKTELYSYIGAIIKDNDSIPILINGVKDHIHILCVMSKNIALAKQACAIAGARHRDIEALGGRIVDRCLQGIGVAPAIDIYSADARSCILCDQVVQEREIGVDLIRIRRRAIAENIGHCGECKRRHRRKYQS